MRRVLVVAAFFAVLTMALITPAFASPDDSSSPRLRTVTELVMTDGSRAYGTVEQETDRDIVFRTTVGAVLTAPRDRILSMRPVAGRMIRGEFRREDPNNTRLLFGPTGRSLKRGETYLGVYEVLMPFVQVGITDRISIGGGTPLIFNVEDWDRLYWVTPKVQLLSRNGTHIAAGLFHGFSGNERAGIAYGVVTREVGSGAFTAGAGIGYNSGGERGALMMIGGEAAVRRNVKWVTENYVWESTVVSSGGFRFFGERLSADLALGFVINGGSPVVPFPVVNFVYRF
jgi:hypothetical protein